MIWHCLHDLVVSGTLNPNTYFKHDTAYIFRRQTEVDDNFEIFFCKNVIMLWVLIKILMNTHSVYLYEETWKIIS